MLSTPRFVWLNWCEIPLRKLKQPEAKVNKQYRCQICERIDAVVKHVVRSNSHRQAEPVHTRWAMIGNAWRKRRWSRHQVDALASILMCKRMTNDQVKWNAKIWSKGWTNQRQWCKAHNDINGCNSDPNKCFSNETRRPPSKWCEAPHMWKINGFQTETTRCCHSFFFESENRHHCSETEQHVFNIGCTQTHHAHAVETDSH